MPAFNALPKAIYTIDHPFKEFDRADPGSLDVDQDWADGRWSDPIWAVAEPI